MKSESTPAALLRSVRPQQWVKNLFVVTPLVFGGKLSSLSSTVVALSAFSLFCLLSGAVYLFNDVRDRENDRRHPLKRQRPVASGSLSVRTALIACGFLALGGTLGSGAVEPGTATPHAVKQRTVPADGGGETRAGLQRP